MTTQQDLLSAMDKESLLTDFGIGIWHEHQKLPKEQRREKFKQERQSLADNFEHFEVCCQWLSLCKRRKTVNHGIPSSYGLKHMAEDYFNTYVTNGAFIAAVIHLGIPYKVLGHGPNVDVALSSIPPDTIWVNHNGT